LKLTHAEPHANAIVVACRLRSTCLISNPVLVVVTTVEIGTRLGKPVLHSFIPAWEKQNCFGTPEIS